jgi:glutathione S-transferase
MTYRLVIGDKNASSWSLRPWLAMRHAGLPFAEVNIDLRAADAKARILAHSPSGKVPALIVDGEVIWDSLAMLELLAEVHPEAALWPASRNERALARSVSAEMHSGFQELRSQCPMDFVARNPKPALSAEVAAEVRRILSIWRDCRRRFGARGPFLFGQFTVADAMYAPVASRFRTYVPDLSPYGDDGTAQAYVDTLFALPAMLQWEREAKAELAARR